MIGPGFSGSDRTDVGRPTNPSTLRTTVFLSLAQHRQIADHDRMVACMTASSANVPQVDLVEASACLRDIQLRWELIQLFAPEEES